MTDKEWKPTHYIKDCDLFPGNDQSLVGVILEMPECMWDGSSYINVVDGGGCVLTAEKSDLILITSEPPSVSEETKSTTAPHGGPSDYYDFNKGFCTANDIMEFLALDRWFGDALHMKDIFKACFRWGKKEGTSKEYDAKKIIYSAARLLRQYSGQEEMRAYLQSLLDDKQFGGKS